MDQRYFEYPPAVSRYFEAVNHRHGGFVPPASPPAPIAACRPRLDGIRAVLWDVYGTLMHITVGDLEGSVTAESALSRAAAAVVAEFQLTTALRRLWPDAEPAAALRDLYLGLIDASHAEAEARGVRYPEVVIEQLWRQILIECQAAGAPGDEEPLDQRAYRIAYAFDAALQHSYLADGAAACLARLHRGGLVQGIISNAQFYTPLHLRRHYRAARPTGAADLCDLFRQRVVLFSYELGYSKPNPGAFERATAALAPEAIAPAHILYVGNDLLNDIWAAQQHGWRTVLVAAAADQTRLRPDEPVCRDVEPDAVIHHLDELAPLLSLEDGHV